MGEETIMKKRVWLVLFLSTIFAQTILTAQAQDGCSLPVVEHREWELERQNDSFKKEYWDTCLLLDYKKTGYSKFYGMMERGCHIKDKPEVDFYDALRLTRIVGNSVGFGTALAIAMIQMMRLLARRRTPDRTQYSLRKQLILTICYILFFAFLGASVPWVIDYFYFNTDCAITFC